MSITGYTYICLLLESIANITYISVYSEFQLMRISKVGHCSSALTEVSIKRYKTNSELIP